METAKAQSSKLIFSISMHQELKKQSHNKIILDFCLILNI